MIALFVLVKLENMSTVQQYTCFYIKMILMSLKEKNISAAVGKRQAIKNTFLTEFHMVLLKLLIVVRGTSQGNVQVSLAKNFLEN